MKNYLGPMVVLLLILNQIRFYGTRWAVGPDGFPTILVTQDGMHHLDGSQVDPLSLYLKVNRLEQGVMLAVLAFIAFCVFWTIRFTRNTARLRQQIAELNRYTHEMERRNKR